MQVRSVNNGLFAQYSPPSVYLARRYGAQMSRIRMANAPAPVRQPPTIMGKPIHRAPTPIMRGNYLGDASINPFTGGDTGVSDPIGATSGFNWASLLTGVAQTATAVSSALHPAIIPRAPTPVAGHSPVLVAAAVGGLGLLAYLALGRRR